MTLMQDTQRTAPWRRPRSQRQRGHLIYLCIWVVITTRALRSLVRTLFVYSVDAWVVRFSAGTGHTIRISAVEYIPC